MRAGRDHRSQRDFVVVEIPDAGDLAVALRTEGLGVERTGDQLLVQGTTRSVVSQIAFDRRIRLDELTDMTKSLEDSLIDLTSAGAEFTSA